MVPVSGYQFLELPRPLLTRCTHVLFFWKLWNNGQLCHQILSTLSIFLPLIKGNLLPTHNHLWIKSTRKSNMYLYSTWLRLKIYLIFRSFFFFIYSNYAFKQWHFCSSFWTIHLLIFEICGARIDIWTELLDALWM